MANISSATKPRQSPSIEVCLVWSADIVIGNYKEDKDDLLKQQLNPLTPRSDWCVNSPYIFKTLSGRQVMRMKKIIN